jgi:hypothetical protein
MAEPSGINPKMGAFEGLTNPAGGRIFGIQYTKIDLVKFDPNWTLTVDAKPSWSPRVPMYFIS